MNRVPAVVTLSLIVCLAIATAAAAQERTVFCYTDHDGTGCFIHLNGRDWMELTGVGDRFTFIETSRGESSIELFDHSRDGVGVRIFKDQSEWRNSQDTHGQWAPLWPGSWKTSADLRATFRQWGLTPTKQGERGTCSVFTTTTALEFAFSRRLGRSVRLSVEYLNWAANRATGESKDGQFFHDCLAGFEKFGICDAADMPYTAEFDPKLAPSAKARANARSLRNAAAGDIRIHWINPWKPKPGLTDVHLHEIKGVLAKGWPVAAGSEHSRLLVGYRDNTQQPGGGVFFDDDSATGNFEEVTYEFVKKNVGDVFWVEASIKPPQGHK